MPTKTQDTIHQRLGADRTSETKLAELLHISHAHCGTEYRLRRTRDAQRSRSNFLLFAEAFFSASQRAFNRRRLIESLIPMAKPAAARMAASPIVIDMTG